MVYIFVHVSIRTTEKALDIVRSGHLVELTLISLNANSFKIMTVI